MNFAKIRNNKVVRVFDIEPVSLELNKGESILPVEQEDLSMFPYPPHFYIKSNTPQFQILTDKIVAVYTYNLKTVEEMKDYSYDLQKKIRQEKQLGVFEFGGMQIPLKDREDSLIISSLEPFPTKFKIGKAEWIELDAAQIVGLKDAHREHVQAAYEWEMNENTKVLNLTTLEELNTYIGGL